MMTFEEFKNEVKDNILKYLPEISSTSTVQLQESIKNNGVIKHGICIKEEGKQISPLIYLEEFYQQFRKTENIEAVLGGIAKTYENSMNGQPNIEASIFLDYDKVKENITFSLVNSKLNAAQLREMPHKKVEDLAQIFHINMPKMDTGIANVKVNNQMMDMWGITLDELSQAATENTQRIKPPVFKSMMNTIDRIMGDGSTQENFLKEGAAFVKDSMYILSNEQDIGGAAAMLYPNVLENIREITGSDFYIIPSSVHEVLIIPMEGAPPKHVLGKMVREVNTQEVGREEILSNCIYEYKNSQKCLKQVPQSLPKEKEYER